MTKRDLSRKLAQAYPRCALREIEVMVDTFFASLTAALGRGERVELRGLGIFGVKERSARDGRNPRTGQMVRVAAKRVPFFKVAKELRARINAKVTGRLSPGRDKRPQRWHRPHPSTLPRDQPAGDLGQSAGDTGDR